MKTPKLNRTLLQIVEIDGEMYYTESISEPNFTAILRGRAVDIDTTTFKFRRVPAVFFKNKRK